MGLKRPRRGLLRIVWGLWAFVLALALVVAGLVLGILGPEPVEIRLEDNLEAFPPRTHKQSRIKLLPASEGLAAGGSAVVFACGEGSAEVRRTKNPYSGARIGPFSRSAARNEKLPDSVHTVTIVLATSSA